MAEQNLLQAFPPHDPQSPQRIIIQAFAFAKATINRALDSAEKAILSTHLTYFAAVLISVLLRYNVAGFVASLVNLVRIARKRTPFRTFAVADEGVEDFSDVLDVVTGEAGVEVD